MGSRRNKLHSPPLFAIERILINNNRINIRVPNGRTCPLQHCIVVPEGGVPQDLRDATLWAYSVDYMHVFNSTSHCTVIVP